MKYQETQFERLLKQLGEAKKWTLKFKETEIVYSCRLDDETGNLTLSLGDLNRRRWFNKTFRYNGNLFDSIQLALPTMTDLEKKAKELYPNEDKSAFVEAMAYFLDVLNEVLLESEY